jgi:hypothetical protein
MRAKKAKYFVLQSILLAGSGQARPAPTGALASAGSLIIENVAQGGQQLLVPATMRRSWAAPTP